MAGLAKSIKIVRAGHGSGQPVMVIDGQEFPFFTVDGYHLDVSREGLPAVRLLIPAECVEVVDTMEGAPRKEGVSARDYALSLAGVEPVGT